MVKKILRNLTAFRQMSPRKRRMEILRWVSPHVRHQYRLDKMVGPVGWWSELQAYQYGALKSLGLRPHHSLLDIGCGPLQGGVAFIRYLDKGKYTGIDLREEAIAEAHTQVMRAGLAAKNPFLAVSESFGRDELDGSTFDYIWCSQLLYHLDEIQMDALLEQVSRRLAPRGVFYGDTIGSKNIVRESHTWNGFRFHLHSLSRLQEVAERHRLQLVARGSIAELGYPSAISLSTNVLIECSRA